MSADPFANTVLAGCISTDADGAMHIDVPRLLAAHGYPNTPRNCEVLMSVAHQVLAEMYPGIPITVTDRPL